MTKDKTTLKESDIQIGIFNWIRENQDTYEVLKVIYHTPNSYFGTNFGVINWLKKLGTLKGVYDICIPIDNGVYPFCYIEIKKDKAKLTKEQEEFRRIINQNSSRFGMFVEIRTVESGIEFIKKYLGLEDEEN